MEYSEKIRQQYEPRLKIALSGSKLELFTKTGLKIATGYLRVVIGGRGPYVEFRRQQLIYEVTRTPSEEEWREHSELAYYDERRTNDSACVKIYVQKKTVKYADYLVGCLYISPFDLYLKDGTAVIEPLKKVKKMPSRGLFD